MTIFLCTAEDMGLANECCCCGGHASDPISGSVPSLIYCSDECMVDWEDFLAGEDEKRLAKLREEARIDILNGFGVTEEEIGELEQTLGYGEAHEDAREAFKQYRDVYLPSIWKILQERMSEVLPDGHTLEWVEAER